MSNERSITPLPPADFTPERGNYITLQPFRYWCQKVLPLVYDDSLSYYELLCKVVDYLNKSMEDIETLNDDVTNVFDAYNELQDYVNNYFSSLDVQEEINNKLNEMATDGTLSALISPYVLANLMPIVVDNISQMTDRNRLYVLSTDYHLYQWNNSTNSFGDTGLVFGEIGNYLKTKTYISSGNLNNLEPNTVIAISYPGTGEGYSNLPVESAGYVVTYQFGDNANAKVQIFYGYMGTTVWTRQCDVNGNWTHWLSTTSIRNGGLVGTSFGTDYPYNQVRDMNEAPVNALISLNAPLPDGSSYLNTPNNSQEPAYVVTYQWGDNNNARMQIYYDYHTGNSWHRVRDVGGLWTPWAYDTFMRDGGIVGSSQDTTYPYTEIRDMNNAPANTVISLNAPLIDGTSYLNTPNNLQEPAYVFTFRWGNNLSAKLQFYYIYYNGKGYYRASDVNGNWTAWKETAFSYTYNTTKNVTENSYNNVYNINTSPNITTDTNGWLASTNDTTDRTADIMAMLNATGYCHLGEGTFYINGQVEMPINNTLVGCGNNTIVKAGSSNTGALIVPTDNCTIKSLKIEGNGQPSGNVTGETGILIFDTKTGFDSPSTHGYKRVLIDGVFFDHFSGSGIELRGTGGTLTDGAIISNCRFEHCSIGVNISFFSEYNKITDCIIAFTNYIGVVNNGGNNSFVNCTISGSNSGFVIDNSDNTLPNQGHGSCVGCCFNHVGNNVGDGIKLLGVRNGFVFSGCELWFSFVRIDSSTGVLFDGIQGGGADNQIIISNSTGITFDGMLMNAAPEIRVSDSNYVSSFDGLIGATASNRESIMEVGSILNLNPVTVGTASISNGSRRGTGFTYGYSSANDSEKDGDGNPPAISASTSLVGSYTLTETYSPISIGTVRTSVSSEKNEDVKFAAGSVVIGLGENKISFEAISPSGSYSHPEYPEYYVVSNLGNTNKDNKLSKSSVVNKTLNSIKSTASISVTGVYPVYVNIDSGSLINETKKMQLTASNVIEFVDVPSEVESKIHFTFDYPSTHTVTSFEIKDLTGKYVKYDATYDPEYETVTKNIGGETISYKRFITTGKLQGEGTYKITLSKGLDE